MNIKIVQRILASVLVLAAGLTVPWFITFALVGALLMVQAISFEVIFIGALLDSILLAPHDGLGGFFFTISFFAFFAVTELTSTLLRHDT